MFSRIAADTRTVMNRRAHTSGARAVDPCAAPSDERIAQAAAQRRRRFIVLMGCCTMLAIAMLIYLAPRVGAAPAGSPKPGAATTKAQATARAKQAAAARKIVDKQTLVRNRIQAVADRLADRRDAAEEQLDVATQRYADHLVRVYKRGDESSVATLIVARDVADAADRLTIMLELTDHDRRIVDEYRAALDEVDALRARSEAVNERLTVASTELDDAQTQLASFTGLPDRTGPGGADDEVVASVDDYFTPTRSTGASATGGGLGGTLGGMTDWATLAAGTSDSETLPKGARPSGELESGDASWYGPGFHGHSTANGEVYDQYAMTAAHKTLPFGTWVKVTATETGESVDVRINDRGPFIDGRIIDLSWAAAQAIGMDGTAAVTVEPYLLQ